MSNVVPPAGGFRYFRVAELAAVTDRYAETAEVELRGRLARGDVPVGAAVVSPWAAHLGGVLGADNSVADAFMFSTRAELGWYLEAVGTVTSVVAEVAVSAGPVVPDWDPAYAKIGSWQAAELVVGRLWIGESFASTASLLERRHQIPVVVVPEPVYRDRVCTLGGVVRGDWLGIDINKLEVT